MVWKIGKHTIKYHWDDGLERLLDDDSKEIIAGAINHKKTRGKLMQDGVWCNWRDTTDDMIIFGITQGWFKH
jgi:hypothetical protein